MGSILFGKSVTFIVKQTITDPTSGFQAMNRNVLILYTGKFFPCDYPDADVLIMLYFAGMRIKELPVIMHTSKDKKSMHAGFKSWYYVFKLLISMIVMLFRKKYFRQYLKSEQTTSCKK